MFRGVTFGRKQICLNGGNKTSAVIEAFRRSWLLHINNEEMRFHKLLHTLFYLCELADFEIDGRIVLIDKKTGRVWR